MKVKSESEVPQSCSTRRDPWTAAYQAPPPMGFSRQEYWSRGAIAFSDIPVTCLQRAWQIIGPHLDVRCIDEWMHEGEKEILGKI